MPEPRKTPSGGGGGIPECSSQESAHCKSVAGAELRQGELKVDQAAITQALKVFVAHDQVVELRALNVQDGNQTRTASGYFDADHLEALAAAVAKIKSASGIYFTINPVQSALLARCSNRVKWAKTGDLTTDKDIQARRWLLIDCDATRPSGISATDEEKSASLVVAQRIAEHLALIGWPSPVITDSGNGFHLYYRIDLPAEDGGLVGKLLAKLQELFGTPAVKVDQTVKNSGRITKLLGTPVRKGDDTPERPHRMARLLTVPESILPVPMSLLEALAEVPEVAAGPAQHSDRVRSLVCDVQAFIDRHGLDVNGPHDSGNGGKKWIFNQCPWREGDVRGSAAIIQLASGAVWAGCQHESCPGSHNTGNHWSAHRTKYGDAPSDNAGGVHAEEAMEDPGGDLWGNQEVKPAVPRVTANRLDSLRWSAVRHLAIPKTVWHWEPYFPEIPFGLLVSLPGHGKSILMIQLAVAIATGLPLFGFPTGTPGGVVILALEDSKKTLHKRLAAAVESYGATFTEEHHRLLDANLRIQFRSENPLAYESPAAHDMALTGLMDEIIAEAETCEAPLQITFIDTFNNVHGGDENSAQETRLILAAIYALHTRLSCSVWALHHVKKVGTARNAPPLVERLDPDLSRGSGAILGGVRGQVQFGWIYPKEATKAGLEPDGAARRYAIMALTKINDGAPSPWLLLEHTANAGLWAPVPNGAEILARLRGNDAIEKASTADLVLMAVYEAQQHRQQLDRAEVASKLFADHKKPSGSLSTYLSRLVTDRLITADKRGLTEAGLRRVKELLDADGGSDAA